MYRKFAQIKTLCNLMQTKKTDVFFSTFTFYLMFRLQIKEK